MAIQTALPELQVRQPLTVIRRWAHGLQNQRRCKMILFVLLFFAMAIMFLLLLTSIFFSFFISSNLVTANSGYQFWYFHACQDWEDLSDCMGSGMFDDHCREIGGWIRNYYIGWSWAELCIFNHIQSYSIIITIVFGIFIFFDWWKYKSNYVCSFSMLFNPAIRAKEASMLFSAHKVGSACTGALTSDMALSVIEKTVNDSKACRKIVFFDLQSVYEPLCFWYFSLRVFYFENYVANWCKLMQIAYLLCATVPVHL